MGWGHAISAYLGGARGGVQNLGKHAYLIIERSQTTDSSYSNFVLTLKK